VKLTQLIYFLFYFLFEQRRNFFYCFRFFIANKVRMLLVQKNKIFLVSVVSI